LVLALLVIEDKDDVPQEKLPGIYEFQKFDAKSISERMLSILYEIDLRKLLASVFLRKILGTRYGSAGTRFL